MKKIQFQLPIFILVFLLILFSCTKNKKNEKSQNFLIKIDELKKHVENQRNYVDVNQIIINNKDTFLSSVFFNTTITGLESGLMLYTNNQISFYFYDPQKQKINKYIFFDFDMNIGDTIESDIYPIPYLDNYSSKAISYLEKIFIYNNDSIYKFRIANFELHYDLVYYVSKKNFIYGMYIGKDFFYLTSINYWLPNNKFEYFDSYYGQVLFTKHDTLIYDSLYNINKNRELL